MSFLQYFLKGVNFSQLFTQIMQSYCLFMTIQCLFKMGLPCKTHKLFNIKIQNWYEKDKLSFLNILLHKIFK